MDEKKCTVDDAVRDATRAVVPGIGGTYLSTGNLVEELERRGWKYDPPTPVLPVVSAPAETAFIAAAGLDGQNRVAGLRAAFKVMLRENLERLAVSDVLRLETQVSIGATRTGIYRILTGEEWPT